MLYVVNVIGCSEFLFQEKLMNQTWKNGKKPSFGHNFGHFGSNLGLQKNFIDFSSTRC